MAVSRVRLDEPSPASAVQMVCNASPIARCPGAFVGTPPGWLQDAFAMAGGSTIGAVGSGPEIAPVSSAFKTEIRRPGSGSCFLSNIEVTEETLGMLGSPSPMDSHPPRPIANAAMSGTDCNSKIGAAAPRLLRFGIIRRVLFPR